MVAMQVGVAMVLGTLIAIMAVDRAGRRQLLLTGGIGMFATEASSSS